MTLAKSAIWCSSYRNLNVSSSAKAKARDEEDHLQPAGEGVLEENEEALNDLKCPKAEIFPSTEGEGGRRDA